MSINVIELETLTDLYEMKGRYEAIKNIANSYQIDASDKIKAIQEALSDDREETNNIG
nr:MAG TPA: hypothetical protein [Caudoviricetes sp.]